MAISWTIQYQVITLQLNFCDKPKQVSTVFYYINIYLSTTAKFTASHLLKSIKKRLWQLEYIKSVWEHRKNRFWLNFSVIFEWNQLWNTFWYAAIILNDDIYIIECFCSNKLADDDGILWLSIIIRTEMIDLEVLLSIIGSIILWFKLIT